MSEATSARRSPLAALGTWTSSASALKAFALASLIANVVIVVTGGAVRLTKSGLGCPTWPNCTSDSLVRTKATGIHGIIEFTNRQLTFVLVLVALITMIMAWRQRRVRLLAALALAGIPAQAVIGGISVLTDLNPWVVALHFLTSMAMIAITTTMYWRLRATPAAAVMAPVSMLARAVVAVTAAVLAIGTIVTGSGSHSGAQHASQRIGLKPSSITQLHADAVMVLIGLSIGLIALVVATGQPRALVRAAWTLLVVELAQGVIGYTQYFLHVPPVLVGLHMLGACLTWIAALNIILRVRGPRRSEQLGNRVDHQADQRADDGSVHPDELKIPADL